MWRTWTALNCWGACSAAERCTLWSTSYSHHSPRARKGWAGHRLPFRCDSHPRGRQRHAPRERRSALIRHGMRRCAPRSRASPADSRATPTTRGRWPTQGPTACRAWRQPRFGGTARHHCPLDRGREPRRGREKTPPCAHAVIPDRQVGQIVIGSPGRTVRVLRFLRRPFSRIPFVNRLRRRRHAPEYSRADGSPDVVKLVATMPFKVYGMNGNPLGLRLVGSAMAQREG